MKTTTLFLILFLAGLGLQAQNIPQVPGRSMTPATPPTFSPAGSIPDLSGGSSDSGTNDQGQMIPAGTIDFQGVDLNQVLHVYAELVNRTILRPSGLSCPPIVLESQTALTKAEAIEALQAVLALNNISVINIGDKFVKVVPTDQAVNQGQSFDQESEAQMPDLGSIVTRIVQLKYVLPSQMVPALTPFARLQNGLIPLDNNGILIIRDYTENVKRMLQMVDLVDVNVPEVYTNEVIPIKYALATDIADALNTLGGSGSANVTIGTTPATASRVNGMGTTPNAAGGINTPGSSYPGNGLRTGNSPFENNNLNNNPFGNTTPGGTTSGANSGTTPFQRRLADIIQRASQPEGAPSSTSQQQPIQLFGQAKIIADQRSNSLLVIATPEDMERIKQIITQLDVLLPQVLISSAIIQVDLQNGLALGVSAAQNPKAFSPSAGIVGGGGSVNGPSFFNFLGGLTTNGYALGTNASAIFGNTLPQGLSYFGDIGPTWNVALQAAANDSSATVIQSPAFITSQATPASFFVGQTVPYVTSTYNNGINGNSASYSQLSVGVELDVTPFINPNGLVVMQVDQEIDGLNGSTPIEGVGNVPNTTKRSLTSQIAVKDNDTVMLGGFIESDKSKSKTGVPFLQDIPLLGNLFTSRSDSKERQETIVLLRPTVLRTPGIAASETLAVEQRLPGVAHAQAQDAIDTQKLIDQERREEIRAARWGTNPAGIYTTHLLEDTNDYPVDMNGEPVDTNSVPADVNGVQGSPNGSANPNPPSYEY